MGLLSTEQAAALLGISKRRVQGLIIEGILPAQKVGRDYVIDEKNLKLAEARNPVGRPPKPKGKGAKK